MHESVTIVGENHSQTPHMAARFHTFVHEVFPLLARGKKQFANPDIEPNQRANGNLYAASTLGMALRQQQMDAPDALRPNDALIMNRGDNDKLTHTYFFGDGEKSTFTWYREVGGKVIALCLPVIQDYPGPMLHENAYLRNQSLALTLGRKEGFTRQRVHFTERVGASYRLLANRPLLVSDGEIAALLDRFRPKV